MKLVRLYRILKGFFRCHQIIVLNVLDRYNMVEKYIHSFKARFIMARYPYNTKSFKIENYISNVKYYAVSSIHMKVVEVGCRRCDTLTN